MGMEKGPEKPPADGHIREIFDSSLAQNTQVTVRKEIRERLGLEKGDILFMQVLKVLKPDGTTKYEWLGDAVPEGNVEEVV